MSIKKSVESAIAKAKEMHQRHPAVEIRVMDKKGKPAICTASDWIYRERVLDGYHTIFSTKDMKEDNENA